LSKSVEVDTTKQTELLRFLKFATVGTIGAAVDFGVLNCLVLGFGIAKEYANVVSVCCAIVSNFIWNRLWTFPESRDLPLHTQFVQFLIVNLIGLGINQFVFLKADEWLFADLLPHPFDYNAAKALAIVVVLFWNFFVNRRWTYREI
jgi:putative flippase GtrA